MKISVLIAAYRAGNYIGKALESVRAQTHADWELIVVEDGSRDQTEGVVKQFGASVPQTVRYENLGQNRGVAVARSHLLSLASGDAIAFLDADDWWTPTHLARAAAAFDAGADFAVSRIQLFDLDAGTPLETYAAPLALFHEPATALFSGSPIITSSSVAFRRALGEKVGAFDSAFRINEDRDYWLRCALAGARFSDTGEITCYYAKHAASTMAKTILWAQQEVAFQEKHSNLPIIPRRLRRRLLAHHLFNYGRLARPQNPSTARAALRRALLLSPSPLKLAHYLRAVLAR